MNILEKYYTEKLYPFQDGVLNLVRKLKTPFYLTGGTALSRCYFNHRFSDDLDLFVNNDNSYDIYIDSVYNEFRKAENSELFRIDYNRVKKGKFHMQIYLLKKYCEEELILKIDFINDIAYHYGDFVIDKVLGKIDSIINILSNKITALFRYEAKDIFDLWIIAKNTTLNWRKLIEHAKTKEAGVDPVVIFDILKSFPVDALDSLKTVIQVDKNQFKKELSIIAENILKGTENFLHK